MEIALEVIAADDSRLFAGRGTDLVQFDLMTLPFRSGDRIAITCDEDEAELEVLLDPSLGSSRIFLTSGRFEFPIPFDKRRRAYPPAAFIGNRIWGYARVLDPRERSNYRNLSLNAYDLPDASAVFPHASSNSGAVDDRFLARNAIDGVTQTCLHGEWPYGSWGINCRDDAWLRVDFGRTVEACELRLFNRADFPHDSWWESAELVTSDGEVRSLKLCKTGDAQIFDLGGKHIEWLRLQQLHRGDDGQFPALSQLQVWGRSA